jgi:hypothetical protein
MPALETTMSTLPEILLGGLHHAGDLVRFHHVGGREQDIPAGIGGKLRADRFQLRRVAEPVQHHVRAGPGQLRGDGEADAARRAGDDRALSLKAHDTHLLIAAFGRQDRVLARRRSYCNAITAQG